MSTIARRYRYLGDRAVAMMASIASSSSAGRPNVETAVRTTGLLTAGRNRGGQNGPVCQPLTSRGSNVTFEAQLPPVRWTVA